MATATQYSPITEHEQERRDRLDDYYEEASGCKCNCFNVFSVNWGRNNDNDDKYLLNQRGGGGETWVVRNLKKVKEASEVIAGPKWKTSIRKISGYLKKMKKQRNNQFQYDPQSYALNFDTEEDDLLLPVFSSRFAVPSQVDEKPSNGLL